MSDGAAVARLRRLPAVAELARVFGTLGLFSVGGPASHLALMEHEIVERRGWLSRDEFVSLVGVTNLIPGPNSTEMAAHIGLRRAGLAGMLAAGGAFILPGALITGLVAWLYGQISSFAAAGHLLSGVKPVVVVIIALTAWRLGRTALRSGRLAALACVALVATLMGAGEVAVLFVGGLAGMAWLRGRRDPPSNPAGTLLSAVAATVPVPPPPGPGRAFLSAVTAAGATSATAAGAVSAAPTLAAIALYFLKIGAVLYGGGYVLIAFLEGGLVDRLHWLTRQELMDAVAIGQFTPGPVLSTATFIGYRLLGWPGAVVATLAIFAPGFAFVAALHRFLPRARKSPWVAAFLDSVNAVSIALMVAVTLRLGADSARSWPAWVIAATAAAAGLRWKVRPPLLIAGGAAAGLLLGRWM